jgi:hypothetical protein
MYTSANEFWTVSDEAFEKAGQWDNRGDGLQLVMLFMALGLAFAAWASLLKEEGNMRVLFAALAVVTMIVGLWFYTAVPVVAV